MTLPLMHFRGIMLVRRISSMEDPPYFGKWIGGD